MSKVGFNILGPRIRDAREKSGRSRADISAAMRLEGIELAEDTFSRLEAGDRRIPDFEILAFCRVLGITIPELFGVRSEQTQRTRQRVSIPDTEAMARIERIRRGVPVREVKRIATLLSITPADLTCRLGIPPDRVRDGPRGRARLSAVDSEKVIRVACILEKATDLFATRESAAGWMLRPDYLLFERAPLDLLDTDVGASLVDAFITGIAAGNFQ